MVEIKESSYYDTFNFSSLIVDWFDNTSEKDYRVERILQSIPDEVVHHEILGGKDVKGIESHSHVTVAVGLDNKEMWKVQEAIALAKLEFPPQMILGKVNFFRSTVPTFDVMYLEITSKFLQLVNGILRKRLAAIDNKFSYTPHMCLSYIEKGTCKDRKGESIPWLTGQIVDIRSIDYILPNKSKFSLKV